MRTYEIVKVLDQLVGFRLIRHIIVCVHLEKKMFKQLIFANNM